MALPSNFNHNIIRLSVRCPSCSNLYDWQRLRILGEKDQQLLAFIDCGVCGTALLSILSISPNGMTAQGLVTDLTVDEVIDLEDRRTIGPDDALEVHEMLEADDRSFFRRS
ncbi:MAG: hypothetical protein HYY50_02060 [Candidatus Kerfeldbacteria bacterium]|nr:hypothetical protein [Candidatus Kerfeldbacteria bacterium]